MTAVTKLIPISAIIHSVEPYDKLLKDIFMHRAIEDQSDGYSLIEALIVCAFAMVLMAIGIPIFKTVTDQSNADSAAQLVAQELNFARTLAVGIHGNVLIQINPTLNSVVVAPGTGSTRGPFVLPGNYKFMSLAPTFDTPDALGGAVLGAGSSTQVTFLDNGAAATDGTGATLCSGTFFIVQASGDASTMRAVTLLGGTGRIHIWRYDPKTTSWK
jgi:Tfp pilus assembly protein FimT